MERDIIRYGNKYRNPQYAKTKQQANYDQDILDWLDVKYKKRKSDVYGTMPPPSDIFIRKTKLRK
jgi:hypothetical protein